MTNTKKTTAVLNLLVLILLAALLTGCSKPSVRLALSSTANLNLNEVDDPLPVVVRIYQLSENKPFQQADFSDLWKKDLGVLGDSLLTRDEIVLNPASQERLSYSRHDQAGYVAVMAVFRRPGENGWRDIQPLSKGFFSRRFSKNFKVVLKGNTITIID